MAVPAEKVVKNEPVDDQVNVFLSYSVVDREIAGRLKKELENFGLSIFLAHEDIEPSEEWQKTILENIGECDVFMPLLTREFKESEWTDQETGIAFAKGKLIIPIKVDIDPYGFIEKFQALTLDRSNITDDAKTIVKTVLNRDDLREKMVDSLIEGFVNSWSYEDAGTKSALLLKLDGLTQKQIDRIVEGTRENRQIYESFRARDNLRHLFSKYKKMISPKVLAEIEELFP
jgi:hypothetical protein